MNVPSVRRLGVATAAAAVGLSLFTGVANATPGSGVTSVEISHRTVGDKDYVLREITIAPHGSTGWHFHDGTLLGYVKQGTLTHFHSDCSVDGVYSAGDTVVEQSGSDKVHIGRNLGETPMVLDVLYIDPAGAPLSEDAPAPSCDK
jgi:quercetin dioxygenase-like cupin family protein